MLSIENLDSNSGSFANKLENEPAVLEFDDRYLQMDFGGSIEKLRYENGNILIQTQNGCVQIKGDSQ